MTNIRARQPYARRPAPQNDLKPFLDTEFANIQRAIPVPLVRAVFADDTVQASDDTIEVDATGGAVTVTLPPPDRLQFLRVTVIRVYDSANAVLVSGAMDGTTSVALNADGDFITLQSDGATWLIFDQSPIMRDVTSFGAIGNGVAEDTTAFQNAIDSFLTTRTPHDYGAGGTGTAGPVAKGIVYVPPGVYIVANVLYRSGITIRGAGRGATTIKLKDNTCPAGGSPDLVGNVFAATLDISGNYTDPVFGPQTWFQGASSGSDIVDSSKNAGKYGTQTSFIATDVTIESLTLDGNKAHNGLADGGGNSSVMGACVALMQTLRGVVRDCDVKNARLDGVTMGYTLHGGSYYCAALDSDFMDNGRCAVSKTTGFGNRVLGCTGTGSGSSDVDIEANWNGEVNAEHSVSNFTGDGILQIASANAARSDDCVVTGGQFKALCIDPSIAAGSIIAAVAFKGDGTGAAISVQGTGPGFVSAYYPSGVPESAPVRVEGCTIRNFATLTDSQPAGGSGMQMYNLILDGNTIDSIGSSGAVLANLYRAFKCAIRDNDITNCGHVDGTSTLIQVLYQGVTTFPNQGQIDIRGNRISGANTLAKFVYLNDGSDAPGVNRGGVVRHNVGRQPVILCIGMNQDTNNGFAAEDNDWMQSSDETASPVASSIFFDATSSTNGTATRLLANRNRISGFASAIQMGRTSKCSISYNIIRNAKLGIYVSASSTNTISGQGDNDVSYNQVHASASGSTFGIQLDVGAGFTSAQTTSSRVMANAVAGFGTANLRDTTGSGTYLYTTAQVAAT